MLPRTTRSEAFREWLEDLKRPKGNCFAHYLLYAYMNQIHGLGLHSDEAQSTIECYLNAADTSLAQILWENVDTINAASSYIPKSIEYIRIQCLTLAECLKAYVLLSPLRYGEIS